MLFYPQLGVLRSTFIGVLLGVLVSSCGARSADSLPPVASASTIRGHLTANSADINNSFATSDLGIVAGAYPLGVLADNPLAYYQLNDSNSRLVDSGRSAVTGAYGSGVSHGVAAITQGGAGTEFPGGSAYRSDGFASTPIRATLQPARLSVEAWFNLNAPNSTNHDLPIVVYGNGSKGVSYGLFIHGLGAGKDCIVYQQHNIGQNLLFLVDSTRLLVGTTYHIVAVSDGANVTIYLDGVRDVSTAYPGSIQYTNPMISGLNIGGALSGNPATGSAPFGGTIAHVAVYGSALSQSSIVNHFLAGQLVPMMTEKPSQSDSFVDSIGVNTHFENHYSVYGTQFDRVAQLLSASGIRHMRLGMIFNNQSFLSRMKSLANSGVFGSYLTQLEFTKSQIQTFPSLVSPSFEQYEAPNEQDDQPGMPNWLAPCREFQKNLYSWVKSDSLTARYPVLGPSLIEEPSFAALGDISAYMDKGNMHNYYSVFNPGTLGWGSISPYGVYGSLAWNVNLLKVTSPNRPIVSTETGYGTSPTRLPSLDPATQMRYMSRLFFEQFLHGVSRSYSYEFVDEEVDSHFSDFGLLQSNLAPKPAYTAIKSLIGALSDHGASFATTPLTYRIGGFNTDVHHLLMQKRNGQYILALWIENLSRTTGPGLGQDLAIPSQRLILSSSRHFSRVTLSTMDENGNLTTTPLSAASGSVTVDVTDKVSLVNVIP